jgi:hypothetical protein
MRNNIIFIKHNNLILINRNNIINVKHNNLILLK